MGDLINGRTPEEIKRVLEWSNFSCGGLDCDVCAYSDVCSRANEGRLASDALALIKHLEAKQPKWISIKERLPTEEDAPGDGRVVCVISKMAGSLAGERRAYHWDMVVNHPTWFTHWMPLPSPPEGE